MKVSRTVAYALQATLQLADSSEEVPVPCSKLASRGRMPERFLLQILRHLVNHGILESTRGVEGGYTLARDPADVSLLQIVEAIEGPLSATMPTSETIPKETLERLHAALDETTASLRRQLEAIKLSQLLPKPPST